MQPNLKLSSRLFYLAIIAGSFFSACRSTKIVSASRLKLMHDFCSPATSNAGNRIFHPYTNTDSLLKQDTLLSKFMTEQDILIANATGTLSLIRKLQAFAADTSEQGQISYLRYREQVQQDLLLFRTEIDAVAAELDCEAGRVQQLSSYLGNINKGRNTKLTVGALLAGSVSTITPIVVKNTAVQNTMVIGSGTISAGLSLLTLKNGPRKIKLMHYRNLLEDIWFASKESTVYPPGILYILNEPKLSNTLQVSKAAIVKQRWLKFELNNNIDSSTERLLFREGGIYSQDNLDLRVIMLNELQAAVRSINQNIQNFALSLNNIPGWVQNPQKIESYTHL